jgi:RNase adaptor protein for sRNA GlmZ degradation
MTSDNADADAILADNLPRGTAHLYTIPAYKFEPPPADICDLYSGVSPIVQDYVMRDSRARKAVRNAVEDLFDFRKREKQREREGRSWKRDVAISVCCNFGTHRSVSVAEMIRERLEDALGGLGMRIMVIHVHRRRGVRDAW